MGNIQSSLLNRTVGGYLAIAVVAAFGYHYYVGTQKKVSKQNARLKGRDVLANQPKKENKAKKQRVETFASQAKTQPKSYAAAAIIPDTKAAPVPSKSKDEIDDHAFAQRMANNKQNKFISKTGSEQKQKQKSVKQSKAKDINEPNKESAPSSIADVDAGADDDQSPITSPSVSAADATGVSDMLEQPSSGPSVLRLTNTEEKPKKAKKAKAPEPTESKKQRQNRQKREQEKAIKEEQEKERKVLEENQRRIARLAEGRAAKDGVAFAAAQKANAWAANTSNGVSQTDASAAHAPLDTFDANSQTASGTAANAASSLPATLNGKENKDTAKENGKTTDWTEVPYSEEQQIKMIEELDEWQPVESKKGKKSKKNTAGAASSDDGSVNETAAPAATISSAPKPQAALANGRPKPPSMPTQSSFAALADDGADLEDVEEPEEWDV
ncbi:unnamed protein product [Discula destructiva]